MQSRAFSTEAEIPRWPRWDGETAVCIATGPSLTRDQVETVKRASVRSIGINDIGLTEPWLDIWYAADWPFWKHYQPIRPADGPIRVSADPKSMQNGAVDLYLNVRAKEHKNAPGFALSGGHSGFQALQIALTLGASRVVLLGYDCKPKGTLTNYFGGKCAALHKNSDYKSWPQFYRDLKLPQGVEVLNATSGSAIDAYPFIGIECLK